MTSKAVGLETIGGVFTAMVNANEPLPASCTKEFTTNRENQASIALAVYEGDGKHDSVKDNRLLNRY